MRTNGKAIANRKGKYKLRPSSRKVSGLWSQPSCVDYPNEVFRCQRDGIRRLPLDEINPF